MKIIDGIVSFSIAIIYNMFIHHFISMICKDLSYEEKYYRSLSFVFITGIFALIVSKIYVKHNTVKKGLFYGGLLLIITGIFTNWTGMTEQLKLIVSGSILVGLIWYSHSKLDKEKKAKKLKK